MKRYVVDRIEGEYAVCESENSSFINISLSELPPVKEGDCLIYDNFRYQKDNDEKKRRKNRIENLMNDLFNS